MAILGFSGPNIFPSNLFACPERAIAFYLQRHEALSLLGFPANAPHGDWRSVGNTFDVHMMKAVGLALRTYLTRWRAYLAAGGHTPVTYAAATLPVAFAHATPAPGTVAGFPAGYDARMLDSGANFTIITQHTPAVEERDCDIPVGIGSGRTMLATSICTVLWPTLNADGKPRLLPNKLCLRCREAPNVLISSDQLAVQNRLDEFV